MLFGPSVKTGQIWQKTIGNPYVSDIQVEILDTRLGWARFRHLDNGFGSGRSELSFRCLRFRYKLVSATYAKREEDEPETVGVRDL